jgi:hypothetical protein
MITITWKIEGLSADVAVDMDASIRRFQALATEALARDGLGGESVPVTCKIASYIASEPEPEDSAAVRAAQVVYQVWHEGAWVIAAEG